MSLSYNGSTITTCTIPLDALSTESSKTFSPSSSGRVPLDDPLIPVKNFQLAATVNTCRVPPTAITQLYF